MSVANLPVGHTGSHRVQFYSHEVDLADGVCSFLREGLVSGASAVVIATPGHTAAIRTSLATAGIDLAAEILRGRLIMLDAEETLAKCLDGEAPAWPTFHRTISEVLKRAAAAGNGVRAYGEMVDVLWNAGKQREAIALEQLWNTMGSHAHFELLCGYASHAVGSVGDARAICDLHSHVAPPPNAGILVEVGAVVAEIARRTETEAALRERTEDLEDFVENAAVAIHRVDRNGIIRWANRTELSLLGYTQQEYVGRHIAEFHADAPVIEDILRRLTRGDTICDYEARLRHKDGSIRHVSISSNFQSGRGGTTRCFSRDITAQKQAEAEREAAMRAKDEFLAMLSHELRNPLSPILTAVQLMRLRGETSSTREQAIIERQVNHLMHLVDDLLDISRIARGKVQLTRRPAKLGPLVIRALEIVSPLCEERRHRVEALIADEDIWIDADETRISQVFTNLLTNAAKYTPPGGRIEVAVTRTAGTAQITVSDTGIGIASDLLPTIFEPFVQGKRETERSRGGLGIGLAIVRNFVALHSGHVSVSSAGAGLGSRFVVELPVIEAVKEAPSPVPERRHPANVTPRRILVVDDNEDAGMLLGDMLRSVGHEVQVALDGPAALQTVQTFRPDVAILDIGLPVMDGYQLAAELQECLGRAVRLMAVTGYGQERDRDRALGAGFEAHFVKPIGLRNVLAAIEETATTQR
jgi:PAS domain S-box-containing protein